MKIKMFWVKLAGVLFTAVILAVYQVNALSLQSARQELKEAEAARAGQYRDGVYVGTGHGYRGETRVRVTVADGRIEAIEITESGDDKAYLSMAESVLDDIITGQTTEDVDTVSGATMSSQGLLEAVENALQGVGN